MDGIALMHPLMDQFGKKDYSSVLEYNSAAWSSTMSDPSQVLFSDDDTFPFGAASQSRHEISLENTYPPAMIAPAYTLATTSTPYYTPQWPSSLLNTHAVHNNATAPPLPPIPTYATVHHQPRPSAQSVGGNSGRRTLTNADRKKMCQYHIDNPSVKQTVIGAMFGVERSTVSKVLRQKDKFLSMEDELSRSPIKKNKGKSPDLEKALTNWAKGHSGRLTTGSIKEKLQSFADVTKIEVPPKLENDDWLDRFRRTYGKATSPFTRAQSVDKPFATERPRKQSNQQLSPMSFADMMHSPSTSSMGGEEIKMTTTTKSRSDASSTKRMPSHSDISLTSQTSTRSTFTAEPPTPGSISTSNFAHYGRSLNAMIAGNNTQDNSSSKHSHFGTIRKPKSEKRTPVFTSSHDDPFQDLTSNENSLHQSFTQHRSNFEDALGYETTHDESRHQSQHVSPLAPSLMGGFAVNNASLVTKDEALAALDTLLDFFQNQTGTNQPEEYIVLDKIAQKLRGRNFMSLDNSSNISFQ